MKMSPLHPDELDSVLDFYFWFLTHYEFSPESVDLLVSTKAKEFKIIDDGADTSLIRRAKVWKHILAHPDPFKAILGQLVLLLRDRRHLEAFDVANASPDFSEVLYKVIMSNIFKLSNQRELEEIEATYQRVTASNVIRAPQVTLFTIVEDAGRSVVNLANRMFNMHF
jgi:hypothetical protein